MLRHIRIHENNTVKREREDVQGVEKKITRKVCSTMAASATKPMKMKVNSSAEVDQAMGSRGITGANAAAWRTCEQRCQV
ncbi:hypothetical protein BHE74_00051912 [Ensete ventricosum]|nr:hypothetical protein BHE74_00051912 [Ensete ventricosum]RZR79583.1 hypothetical protein BHM03_00005317 [Ensete ventricosum]